MDIRTVVSKTLGPVVFLESEAPGVYYVSVRAIRTGITQEYYIVEIGSDVISDEAKDYGNPLRNHPELISFRLGANGTGAWIIKYEIALYRILHNLSAEGDSIYEIAMHGMIDYPDYFGSFPAPVNTPEGRTIRYTHIRTGVFDLFAESGTHMVAVAEPVYDAELSEEAISKGVIMDAYIFFYEGFEAAALKDLKKDFGFLK